MDAKREFNESRGNLAVLVWQWICWPQIGNRSLSEDGETAWAVAGYCHPDRQKDGRCTSLGWGEGGSFFFLLHHGPAIMSRSADVRLVDNSSEPIVEVKATPM